jgi:hypothetical protein
VTWPFVTRSSKPTRPTRRRSARSATSRSPRYIDWLTIADREQSVVDDVTRIRTHPLVPARIPIYGYLYDVGTGRLIEVA